MFLEECHENLVRQRHFSLIKRDFINSFMTEAVIIYKPVPQISCSANQWTGFYMITASVMKELMEKHYQFISICLFHTDQMLIFTKSFEILLP